MKKRTLFRREDEFHITLTRFVSWRKHPVLVELSTYCIFKCLTLEASKKKIVTRSLKGGGGGSIRPPPFYLSTQFIRLTMKLGTYHKLHLFFQLSETTWCLIGFDGNNNQINEVTGGPPSWIFKIFRFCSNFHFCTSKRRENSI